MNTVRFSILNSQFSICLLLLLGCHGGAPRPSNQTPVILITIDTLRSDHLPAYGYRGVETPAIDALRADSILYQRAYSHVPLTLPSHATMFTGRLPADNGVRDNLGFQLGPKVPTIAAVLKGNGYATGAAVSAFVLRKESGISRGFDFYDDNIDAANSGASVGRVQRKGDETARVAEQWIGAHASKPFFFFLHLYEPHTPYDPPEPFRSRYPSAYDGEIASADAIVGGFVDFLKREGLYDRALIILLSDHGEGLNDHGEQEHGIFLYREALQVPLMVKLPRSARKGESVTALVQLSDVFPTIASMTASHTAPTSARSLIESGPERQIYSETLFPKFHYGWSDLHSLIAGQRHYIHAPKPELYDLAGDAAEKRNILTDDRRSFAAMSAAILPLVHADAAPSAVSPEEQQKLAALGYIGSASTTQGELPDPKDKIAVSGDIRAAFVAYDKGKYTEALPLLERLTRENPLMLDVWDMLARTYDQLGRTPEGIEAAKRGLRLSPRTTHLALMIAKMSLDTNDLDQAQRHAELALQVEPGLAHDILGRIWLARGDLTRAEQEARLALRSRDQVFALLTLGNIEKTRKNYPAALEDCDRALEILAKKKTATGVKGLYFLRGDLLARLARDGEAEAAFRKEIELFPRDPQAYRNLILLLATEGRNEDATKLVYALVEKAPTPPSYIAISQTLKTIGDDSGARYWAVQGLRQFPKDARLRKLAS